MIYTDCHLHSSQVTSFKKDCRTFCATADDYVACTTALNQKDFYTACAQVENLGNFKICIACGVHPLKQNLDFVQFIEEKLIEEKKILTQKNVHTPSTSICAIGEAGYDLFFAKDKQTFLTQNELFLAQVNLAIKYQKPLVIHCVKGMQQLLAQHKLLCQVPSCVLHGFCGTLADANYLIKKGVNAFFSIGKQVLNGNKRVTECAKFIPIERLLLETDAPYQVLKIDAPLKTTPIYHIKNVYNAVANLRAIKVDSVQYNDFAMQIYNNFVSAFFASCKSF